MDYKLLFIINYCLFSNFTFIKKCIINIFYLIINLLEYIVNKYCCSKIVKIN